MNESCWLPLNQRAPVTMRLNELIDEQQEKTQPSDQETEKMMEDKSTDPYLHRHTQTHFFPFILTAQADFPSLCCCIDP